jgi:hypothetical protein
MSTTVSYVKGGIRIQCDQSAYPAEEPQTAYPIPNFPGVQLPQITAATVAITGQGAAGINVQSTGPLPAPAATWTLYDQAWQGSTPATLPTPTAIPVTLTNGMLNYTLSQPLAGASHSLWLESVDGKTTTTYPPILLTTPTDPTSGNISAASAAAAAAQSTANSAVSAAATAQGTASAAASAAATAQNTANSALSKANAAEPALGNPGTDGWLLSSTALGLRSWVAPGGYTLPAASAGTLGGVKVGTGLAIDGSGVLSTTGGSSSASNPLLAMLFGGL